MDIAVSLISAVASRRSPCLIFHCIFMSKERGSAVASTPTMFDISLYYYITGSGVAQWLARTSCLIFPCIIISQWAGLAQRLTRLPTDQVRMGSSPHREGYGTITCAQRLLDVRRLPWVVKTVGVKLNWPYHPSSARFVNKSMRVNNKK